MYSFLEEGTSALQKGQVGWPLLCSLCSKSQPAQIILPQQALKICPDFRAGNGRKHIGQSSRLGGCLNKADRQSLQQSHFFFRLVSPHSALLQLAHSHEVGSFVIACCSAWLESFCVEFKISSGE
jgi:hypothetical protein